MTLRFFLIITIAFSSISAQAQELQLQLIVNDSTSFLSVLEVTGANLVRITSIEVTAKKQQFSRQGQEKFEIAVNDRAFDVYGTQAHFSRPNEKVYDVTVTGELYFQIEVRNSDNSGFLYVNEKVSENESLIWFAVPLTNAALEQFSRPNEEVVTVNVSGQELVFGVTETRFGRPGTKDYLVHRIN
jgi:hypothetical protein